MGFFTKIGKLLTGSGESTQTTISYPGEEYKGFVITPQPIAENGQFRIGALIEKKGEGEQEGKQHQFIRSDTCVSSDQAAELALTKCKIFIDQMGDNIFD